MHASLTENVARASLHEVTAVLAGIFSECGRIAAADCEYSLPLSGKLVRTKFTLLLAEALGLACGTSEKLSVCAELVHTASLLHDDCIDGSSVRRGQTTANKKLGINRAVLLGDLIVTHAFKFSSSVSQETTSELVQTVQRMAEGVLLEERLRYKTPTRAQYTEILSMKTGALFRWCAVSCCRMAQKDEVLEDCASIGEKTGICFQIIDDVMDYETQRISSGKDTLKDLTGGKLTLPILMALEDSSAGAKIQTLLTHIRPPHPDIKTAMQMAKIVRQSGFLQKARECVCSETKTLAPLIGKLPVKESALRFKDYLETLAQRTS